MKKNINLLFKLNEYWYLLAIILLAFFLRFFLLGKVPLHLNRDEAAIGYNAFSLYQTGRDEHGVLLPINLASFGDWKLPVYVYATIPFIALFGLSAWSIKLPAALSGVAIIPLLYYLLKKILANYGDSNSPLLKKLPLLASLIVAVSPWAIHLSRLTYETNLALAIFLAGWLLLEQGKEKIFAANIKGCLPSLLGICCLFLTAFTYHAYQVFIPLFVLMWLCFNLPWLKKLSVVATTFLLSLLWL